jgi:hypothetical protein
VLSEHTVTAYVMAVASTYMIFPNDLMLNVNRVQRVFDDMSVSAVDDKLEETAAYDHQQRPSVSGTAVLQAQQGQAASTSPVSLSQQQTFNNNKKSLASRPFDLLRWFTPYVFAAHCTLALTFAWRGGRIWFVVDETAVLCYVSDH